MSSWTALTWYTAIKTAFKAQDMESEYFGILIEKDFIFKRDYRKCSIYKEIQHITTRNS